MELAPRRVSRPIPALEGIEEMIATPDRRQPNRGRSKTHWQKAARERQKVEQDVILRQLTSLDDWQSTIICLSTPSVKSEPVDKLPPPAFVLTSRCIAYRLNLPVDGRIHVTTKRSAQRGNNSPTSLFSDGGDAGNHESCEQRTQGNKPSCFHQVS
jgi:hypothetical protein